MPSLLRAGRRRLADNLNSPPLRTIREVELAGVEPATSWVRSRGRPILVAASAQTKRQGGPVVNHAKVTTSGANGRGKDGLRL
jgi:hypothetical protein